jgi:hypothetical protein
MLFFVNLVACNGISTTNVNQEEEHTQKCVGFTDPERLFKYMELLGFERRMWMWMECVIFSAKESIRSLGPVRASSSFC